MTSATVNKKKKTEVIMLIVKMAVQGPVEPKQSICPHQYQIYTMATYTTVQAYLKTKKIRISVIQSFSESLKMGSIFSRMQRNMK